jgi:hypothetical protein
MNIRFCAALLFLYVGACVDEPPFSDRRLILAAKTGDTNLVHAYLSSGGHIDKMIEHSRRQEETMLHTSVGAGNVLFVQYLLDSGADPNIGERWTQEAPILWVLGSDVPIPDQVKIVRLLLDNGADPNLANRHGTTALHWAARFGNEEIVRLLVESGSAVNAADVYGITPLHYAKNASIARQLLDMGADINARSTSGALPYDTALYIRNKETAAFLVDAWRAAHSVDPEQQ